jgi:hypothetical protein
MVSFQEKPKCYGKKRKEMESSRNIATNSNLELEKEGSI